MLDRVKKFVEESFKRCASGSSTKHFERTVYWVEQLKPNADEPILIAAYAHDIARALRKKNSEQMFKDKESIDRVYNMVKYHEEGDNEEANLIKDADSISYLENNAVKHIKLAKKLGKDKIKNKIDWMYNRISSEKAKLLAKSYYEKAIDLLNSSKFQLLPNH